MNTGGSFSGIKRTRQSRSCEICRARRVKCDLDRPSCSNCTKNGVACVYPLTTMKRKPSPNLESDRVKRKTGESPVFRSGHLSVDIGGRSRYAASTFWACVDEDGLDVDSLLSDLPLFPLESVCCTADNELHRSEGCYSCRHYVGTTEPNFSFWASLSQRARESRTLASLLVKLPPKSLCDQYYSTFLSAIHPLVPLIHVPTFKDHYDRFWEWFQEWDLKSPPRGVLLENPSLLPLLIAILFSGAIAFSQTPAKNALKIEKRHLHMTLYSIASDSLTMVGFPHSPSIYSLMAFLLLQTFQMQEEESLSSISFVPVAFRIAQAMGLHTDGANFGLNAVQIEERRRVWRYILHLDVMTSMISGLPLVANTSCSVASQTINELKDEFINTKELLSGAEPSNMSNYYLGHVLAAGRYDVSSFIRVIINRHSSSTPLDLSEVRSLILELQSLRERTNQRLEKLSAIHRAQQEDKSLEYGSSTVPDAFKALAEDLINLTVDKAYCMLYLPLMKDPILWDSLRCEGIANFQSWLRIFLRMCRTKEYRPYQWLYPGTYQPLQAAAALLLDLRRSSGSEESTASLVLLEDLFSLLGPEGRIGTGQLPVGSSYKRHESGGAKAAWTRLQGLRKKVWKQMGLDPNVMWRRTIGNFDEGQESTSDDFHQSSQRREEDETTASDHSSQQNVSINEAVFEPTAETTQAMFNMASVEFTNPVFDDSSFYWNNYQSFLPTADAQGYSTSIAGHAGMSPNALSLGSSVSEKMGLAPGNMGDCY